MVRKQNITAKLKDLKRNFFITLLLIWVFLSCVQLTESILHNEEIKEKDLQELDKVAIYLLNKI